MEQTRWEAEQKDHEGLIQDFVSNCISPAEVPEFDRAMYEVLSRLKKEPFDLITSVIDPFVFNSFGGSVTDLLFIPCDGALSSRPLKNGGHRNPVIVIGGSFMERSEKGRVGEIAHEFAHVVLAYTEVEDHKHGGTKAEELTDQLACRWGFQPEIDELNSDGNGPHG